MKKVYMVFLSLVLVSLTLFGLVSLFDRDKQISEEENRGLKQKPAFTFASFFSGDYMEELDAYYTDQFPLREQLMSVNKLLNRFYAFTGKGDSGSMILDFNNNVAKGGITGEDPKKQTSGETPTQPDPGQPTVDPLKPETQESTGEEEPTEPPVTEEPEPPKEDPELDEPVDAQTISSLLVSGDRAMEIVYENKDNEVRYAEAVNKLAEVLGPNVQTYSIVTPNSAQFYGGEAVRSGSTDQKNMIDYVYSNLSDKVKSVDAYSKLRSHTDEYIYFRTDHHWTALGAYYAYTAFCETAGLEPAKLSQFESGLVKHSGDEATTFLGTFYSAIRNYPQGDVLKANPDSVTYYMPFVKTNAIRYGGMQNGEYYERGDWVTTVARTYGDSYLYLAFLCGDQPIEIIETDVDNDRVCMVLKESYGNSFVPFLTTHFSKIVVVDPRYHNNGNYTSLYLPELAEKEGVTDLIVINYPFIPQSDAFIAYLNRLATK